MREPRFWQDHLTEFSLCVHLKAMYPTIKKEILDFLEMPHALHDYPQYKIYYDKNAKNLYENVWKAAPLSKFEREYIDTEQDTLESQYARTVVAYAKKQCPTVDLCIQELEDIGVLRNAFISKLEPGSVIHPHKGRSNDYMRIHLCIIEDPMCRITVDDETRTWKEGQILAFKDGEPFFHSVKHEGSSTRIILSVDVRLDYIFGEPHAREVIDSVREARPRTHRKTPY